MPPHTANLRRLDAIIWAIIAAVAAVVAAACLVSAFHLDARSFLLPGLTAAVLLAGQWFYENRRHDPRLAGALSCTAQIIAFAAVGAPLSYLAASVALPLQDHVFDAADRALGFDWLALLAWMDAHASIHPLFRAIYFSLMPQAVVVVLSLALVGRLEDVRVFMLSFAIATLITIAVSAAIPAEGAWLYYHLPTANPAAMPASHTSWPAFHGLRDGTLRTLVASGAEGIITFPSLHAALAVLLAYGLWPVRWLRWPAIALNTAMLVTIPIEGSHYLADILAGFAVALVSLAAARAIAAQQRDAARTGPLGIAPAEQR